MGKIRVYELAKEAGVESKVLTAQLIELGYKVRAYNSTLDEETAAEIRTRLGFKKVEVKVKRIESKGRTTIIRRRKKVASESVPDIVESEGEEKIDVALESSVQEKESETVAPPAELVHPEETVPAVELEEAAGERYEAEAEEAGKVVAPEETSGVMEEVEAEEAAQAEVEAEIEVEVEASPQQEEAETVAIEEKSEAEPQDVPSEELAAADVEAEGVAGEPTKTEVAEEVDKESLAVPETAEKKPIEKEPVKQEAAPVKRKKGLAKIIGRTELPLQVDTPKPKPKFRPKKAEKPKNAVPEQRVAGEVEKGADGDKKGKAAKKGKRFVRFSHEPQPAAGRYKKGANRKGQVVVDADEIGQFSGRLAGGVKFGRGNRGGRKKKKRDEMLVAEVSETKAIKKRIKVFETISVGDLAHRMGIKANEIIGKLIALGVMATVNQALDVDTATLVANDFGFEVEQGVTDEQSILNLDEAERGGEEVARPPVVTVMGHVDHGKTSILDAIRNTDVAAGEAGGITQHIGAHYVRSPQGDLVFLDTPGHAAFTEMRSRGAQVTDVVVLVVAADDGVMDQTKEAINHAKAAGVPILVAVNKIDKEDADPSRAQRELAELDLVPEEWGGDTIFCETSAKKGIGIEDLVENILLQTEILELKADPKRRAKGWVIEAQLHKGRGAVATVLVQHGTLRVGDHFVAGLFQGKVRSLTDDKGKQVLEAYPSMPVEVQGLSGVPKAGDEFVVVPDEKMARSVTSDRQLKSRESALASSSKISLDNLFDKLQEGEVKELRVLLRADVQGTLEAFGKAIEKLSTDDIKVKILHEGTGTIVESDVRLAAASDALIIGFNVRPSVKVADLAKAESVDLRFYDVIYHALDDIKKAMVGLLDPTFVENVIGSVDVRETFNVPKIGTIAGSYVTDGKIVRNAQVRLLRDGVVIYTGNISSLRRFKDDAKEVQAGYECGVGIENYNDIKIGDQLEVFVMEETEAEL